MRERSVDNLKTARDYLFELYDQDDREELKIALRLVNREIRRQNKPDHEEAPAANNGQPWSGADDEFLRNKLALPTKSKDEAKRILIECSQYLRRTDAETYSRIRSLQLHTNLHAWGNKPKVQWQTTHVSRDEPSLPGAARDTFGTRTDN
ncbi:MAG: hypothetical protein OET44_05925 [Gammaproteobacteria bacterium]|nr:hypothetical protein [Gammaproteobacteria bacterium]